MARWQDSWLWVRSVGDGARQMDGASLRQGTPRPGLGDPEDRFRRRRSPVGEAIARPPAGVGWIIQASAPTIPSANPLQHQDNEPNADDEAGKAKKDEHQSEARIARAR